LCLDEEGVDCLCLNKAEFGYLEVEMLDSGRSDPNKLGVDFLKVEELNSECLDLDEDIERLDDSPCVLSS